MDARVPTWAIKQNMHNDPCSKQGYTGAQISQHQHLISPNNTETWKRSYAAGIADWWRLRKPRPASLQDFTKILCLQVCIPDWLSYAIAEKVNMLMRYHEGTQIFGTRSQPTVTIDAKSPKRICTIERRVNPSKRIPLVLWRSQTQKMGKIGPLAVPTTVLAPKTCSRARGNLRIVQPLDH